jgi:predicted amidohydrolase
MKVYCCQFDIQWENKKANFAKVRSMLEATRPEAESLVLLPEMFAVGFSMNVGEIAEAANGETEQFLSNTARELNIYLMGGVVGTADAYRGRNEAVLFGTRGELVARYSKVQPFTPGGESQNYQAGDRVVVVPWRGFSLAPFVCYDLRFPELFRSAVRRGSNLMTVIANWPVARIDHWVALLRARAIENQAYVAGVNRCGNDPKLAYNGHSIIVHPSGRILADAGEREGIIHADINDQEVATYRSQLPFLKDILSSYAALGT